VGLGVQAKADGVGLDNPLRTGTMKNFVPQIRCSVAALGCCFALSLHAQEALRDSIAGEKAAAARRKAIENKAYNLKLGPVSFALDSSLGIELNDNVNFSKLDQQGDLILRPTVSTRVFWPVSEKNALNFSVGMGYAKYFNYPDYDQFVVAPGSELSFDLFVKDFRFTVFDRFSYTQNPIDVGSLSGVANYGALENTAGANAAWDLYKVILSAGYGHLTWISSTPQFEYLDRASELFNSRAAFALNPALVAGLEGTGSLTAYDTHFLHDSYGYSAGVFAEWKLTDKLQAQLRGGYVNYVFDSGGPLSSTAKPIPYYVGVKIGHILNEHITHSIEGSRAVRLGVYSDYEETTILSHSTEWKIIRGVGLGTQIFYEHGTYPTAVFNSPGLPAVVLPGETYDRVGAGVSLTHQLMEKLSASVAYRFTLKNSDSNSRDYTQNTLTVSLTYRF
jgi:hypothetical protein